MLKAINKMPDDWWYTRNDFYTVTSNEINAKESGFIYINIGGMAHGGKNLTEPDNLQTLVLPYITY